MKNFIGIKEYLANSLDTLSLDRSWGSRIKRFIYKGVLDIGGQRIFCKEISLKLEDCKASLPADYISAHQIQLQNAGGCCTPKCDKTLKCCVNNSCGCNEAYTVSENIGELVFSSNSDQFDCVILQYYACLVDDAGDPLVPLSLCAAVDEFIRWKVYQVKRDMSRGNNSRNNSVAASEVLEAKSTYYRLKAQARAKLAGPQGPQELYQLADSIIYEMPNNLPAPLLSCCRKFYDVG